MSNWILPFCIGKTVKSICKYLGWLLEFGKNSFHFASYLWAMIICAPNTSLEGNDVGGVWNQDAEPLLWDRTALAILCTWSFSHTSTLWTGQGHWVLAAPWFAHCYQWWHWDLIDMAQGSCYRPSTTFPMYNEPSQCKHTVWSLQDNPFQCFIWRGKKIHPHEHWCPSI